MTCFAFLPAWNKDVAPYPRFDTAKMVNVKAGIFDDSLADAAKLTFKDVGLTGSKSL